MMKLIIITANKSFEADIKKILKQAKVSVYTHNDVNGFRDDSAEAIGTNWFGSEAIENESVLFFAFVEERFVTNTKTLVDEFNRQEETDSRIHIAILNIEQSN